MFAAENNRNNAYKLNMDNSLISVQTLTHPQLTYVSSKQSNIYF